MKATIIAETNIVDFIRHNFVVSMEPVRLGPGGPNCPESNR